MWELKRSNARTSGDRVKERVENENNDLNDRAMRMNKQSACRGMGQRIHNYSVEQPCDSVKRVGQTFFACLILFRFGRGFENFHHFRVLTGLLRPLLRCMAHIVFEGDVGSPLQQKTRHIQVSRHGCAC